VSLCRGAAGGVIVEYKQPPPPPPPPIFRSRAALWLFPSRTRALPEWSLVCGRGVRGETVAIVVSRPWAQLDKDKCVLAPRVRCRGLPAFQFASVAARRRWVLIAEDSVLMSWGKSCKVFVYEKLPDKKAKKFSD
jgi:hypothetical protein